MLSPAPPSATRICGPAYTVRMVLSSQKTAPRLERHFVDTATEGSVIVVDAPPRLYFSFNAAMHTNCMSYVVDAKNAVWGGLMTAGAIARGACGVIISGRCRDISEHREANFPLFARGQSTVGQSPFTRPSEVNVPLTLNTGAVNEGELGFPSTVSVEPGDWMVGDEDGVVCVPRAMLERVVELAKLGREVDAKCLADIKSGIGVQESFKRHRGK
jgi:regulator of RNase E activity RraA